MTTDIVEGQLFPQDERAPADKIKVFVSYSRHDSGFVGKVTDALSAQGDIHAFRDTDDILPTEEWKQRLASLISQADSVVFCLSPHSANSEVCTWEVEYAESLNKRIIPIVVERVEDGIAPEGLARINYIFFDSAEDFKSSFDSLIQALHTDIDWIREHTRIGELARRWDSSHRRDDLLRGMALFEAEQWAKYRPGTAPVLSDHIKSFIAASSREDKAEQQLKWRLQAAIYTLLISLIVGLAGYINRQYLWQQWYLVNSVQSYVLSAHNEATLIPGNSFEECADCPTLVVIRAGSFAMGSPENEAQRKDNEGPVRTVDIERFAIGKYEVTHDEWDACVAFTDQANLLTKRQRKPNSIIAGCAPAADSGYGTGRHPVINISWYEAQGYVAWLNRITTGTPDRGPYRLPSEAEWEFAARGGNTLAYSWGSSSEKICDFANVANKETKERFFRTILWPVVDCPDNFLASAPVGSFRPNQFDLYDVHGNAWEWVQDCWNNSYLGAPRDGSPWLKGECKWAVIRGGSWGDPIELHRSASRFRFERLSRSDATGFRVTRRLRSK